MVVACYISEFDVGLVSGDGLSVFLLYFHFVTRTIKLKTYSK